VASSHLPDEQLLLDLGGELPVHQVKDVQAHLSACASCRARRLELEATLANFIGLHHQALDADVPPIAASRASLRAKLAALSAIEPNRQTRWASILGSPALRVAATAFLVLAFFFSKTGLRHLSPHQDLAFSMPDARLTPGAAFVTDRQAVCALDNIKNKDVPPAVEKKVFEEYGIPSAEPRAYEVDYLVTPALGGSDDIRNLWPHSYSATVWNSRVKDELEDRLREMVCGGNLDLNVAQHEISSNWIAAYKKYFHTERPLLSQ